MDWGRPKLAAALCLFDIWVVCRVPCHKSISKSKRTSIHNDSNYALIVFAICHFGTDDCFTFGEGEDDGGVDFGSREIWWLLEYFFQVGME